MRRLLTQVVSTLRGGAERIPQSKAAVSLMRRVARSRLRILAFHGVPDLEHFRSLVELICREYTPVGSADVARALNGDPLPSLPVWFTFDDGLASTLGAGQMLADHGVSATAFVCPGVVGTSDMLWFQIVDRARAERLIAPSEADRFGYPRLKALPDGQRRSEVAVLRDRLASKGKEGVEQPDLAVLQTWSQQGHDIGNHSWDHPMIDTCSESEQTTQITRAHRTLLDWGFEPTFFAYPNGNGTPHAARVAQDLGYSGSVLFDHRLAGIDPKNRHRISRLRIDSTIGERRCRSILSGAHSAAFHLASSR